MKTKHKVLGLTLAIMPATMLAADGQVLINQSTVTAAGGFPYTISQSGSYKLSGNLTMSTTQNGNHGTLDIAIIISAPNVTLDFNGFSLIIANNITNLAHRAIGIGGTTSIAGISIQNGGIVFTGTGTAITGTYTGIDMLGSGAIRIETISVFQPGSPTEFDSTIRASANSIVRHVVTNGNIDVTCPSVVVESIARTIRDPFNVGGCASANNTSYVAQ